MLLVVTLAVLFFIIGLFFKSALDVYSYVLSIFDWNELLQTEGSYDDTSTSEEFPFFDHVEVTLGPQTNDALQAIFDIIIERYLLSWYRNLSGSPDFPIQARMYLQHLSSALIHRSKSIQKKDFSVERLVKLVFGHLEHITSILQSIRSTDCMLEDSVIRGFGSHLHIAMASRTTELAYLRTLVNRLLPYVSLPPGLLPQNTTLPNRRDAADLFGVKQDLLSPQRKTIGQTRRNTANANPHVTHSSPNSALATTPALLPFGANRAAYSLLVEILSTCVLLPAMDAIANPDFINKIVLQCFSDASPPAAPIPPYVTHVPVLNSYVVEWRKWLLSKPIGPLRLRDILQRQEEFHSFTQYMKSIRSTVALTTVLLMNDVDQRIRSGSLSTDTCHEVRTQIRHILQLIRGLSTPDFEPTDGDYTNGSTEKGRNVCTAVSHDTCHGTRPLLFGLSNDFEALLITFLNKPPETKSLIWLTHKSLWKDSCNVVFEAIERRYLPLYIESPEYLSRMFGMAPRRSSAVTTGHSGSPRRVSTEGSSLFGIPLRTLFSTPTVEGRVLRNLEQDTSRPVVSLVDRSTKSGPRSVPLRDRATEALNTEPSRALLSGLTTDSQHQLHVHYLLHSHQIDMSDWRVFIPGLCRPEVQPGRRLIDQLVPSGATPIFSHSARSSEYAARPHDATFKAKILNELNLLQSGPNRLPQLSSQFMYTVRTERIVNGARQPIARVARKYSEFYVLEQKLLEFHGSAITRQLPKKQLVPRTFEYLESKRELLEDHLQYLISQPFLRNSELLHGFLTSKTTFSNNVLFELNLGRFAKSVPLKLAKEKGQFLDSFLVAFYISCNPQPISMEPVDLRPSEPVLTVLPGGGVGTLAGIDAMISADHYVCGATDLASSGSTSGALSDRRRGSVTTTIAAAPPQSKMQTSLSAVNGPPNSRNLKRTWLENRLRTKAFWNNASLSTESKMDLSNTPCNFVTIYQSGLCELFVFVFENLIHPDSTLLPIEAATPESRTVQSSSSSSSSEPSSAKVVRKTNSVFDPWDVTSVEWSEAALNGPLPQPSVKLDTNPLAVTHLERAYSESSPQCSTETEQTKPELRSPLTVSITLADLLETLRRLFDLVSTHLTYQVRHLLLWTAHLVCRYFSKTVSRWLTKHITAILIGLLTDENLAYALQALKATLFYPYTPSTESEKDERKLQAHASLRRLILDHPVVYIFNREELEHCVDRLFFCFQHPKWNKQLTYTLLDQLVIDLFPELSHSTRFT
ncbi:unnamed protein product [Dicrocoelium dendriticum]|nr:unnamed protein product [Dicrocoelium dendriticum]